MGVSCTLRPEFHAICVNNATHLFGDDLAKQIRDAKETNRLGKTVAGPSQQFDHNKGYRRYSSWSNKASQKHHKRWLMALFFGERPPLGGKKETLPRQDRDRQEIIASLAKIKLAVTTFLPFIESNLKKYLIARCDTFAAGCIGHFLRGVERNNF